MLQPTAGSGVSVLTYSFSLNGLCLCFVAVSLLSCCLLCVCCLYIRCQTPRRLLAAPAQTCMAWQCRTHVRRSTHASSHTGGLVGCCASICVLVCACAAVGCLLASLLMFAIFKHTCPITPACHFSRPFFPPFVRALFPLFLPTLLHRARAADEGWSFAQMATQAYMDRIDLSAHGFYATPEITGACLLCGVWIRRVCRL